MACWRSLCKMSSTGKQKLGMMRHLYLLIDLSECMANQDLKPTRLHCTLKLLESFIDEYFYLNPISQLGIVTTSNKRAEKVSEMTGNPRKHTEVLKSLSSRQCTGEPSLQNSLELIISSLKHMPPHASREVIIIMGSLTTCDPGDIACRVPGLRTHPGVGSTPSSLLPPPLSPSPFCGAL